jgi:hypothetical protein
MLVRNDLREIRQKSCNVAVKSLSCFGDETSGSSDITFLLCIHFSTSYRESKIGSVRFQVLTAASMKKTVFWDVMPRSLVW